MAKRGSGGKPWAAGAPGQISCTNNSYSPGISMHTLPKNEKVRAQWVKFVRTRRPDWEPTEYSYLCSLHFYESCYTCLRLSTLMPAETSQENGESSGPSNKGFQEKRVFVKGSVPTIHQEPNDRNRRRSNAVSVQSSYCVFNFHNKPVMFVFGSFSGSFWEKQRSKITKYLINWSVFLLKSLGKSSTTRPDWGAKKLRNKRPFSDHSNVLCNA